MVDSDIEVISREEASRYGRGGTSALATRLAELDLDKDALRVRVRKDQKASSLRQQLLSAAKNAGAEKNVTLRVACDKESNAFVVFRP